MCNKYYIDLKNIFACYHVKVGGRKNLCMTVNIQIYTRQKPDKYDLYGDPSCNFDLISGFVCPVL